MPNIIAGRRRLVYSFLFIFHALTTTAFPSPFLVKSKQSQKMIAMAKRDEIVIDSDIPLKISRLIGSACHLMLASLEPQKFSL